jgi:hypothetical protein
MRLHPVMERAARSDDAMSGGQAQWGIAPDDRWRLGRDVPADIVVFKQSLE